MNNNKAGLNDYTLFVLFRFIYFEVETRGRNGKKEPEENRSAGKNGEGNEKILEV